jgi:hypothetical protein
LEKGWDRGPGDDLKGAKKFYFSTNSTSPQCSTKLEIISSIFS